MSHAYLPEELGTKQTHPPLPLDVTFPHCPPLRRDPTVQCTLLSGGCRQPLAMVAKVPVAMVAKVPEGLWDVSSIVEGRELGSVVNKLPRPRASFERALHFRTTPFTSVGDILNAVGEQDRRNFRYRHLAFAIGADFHSRHYGVCQLGAHNVSFRPNECWGEQNKFTLARVPVSLKSAS